MAQNISEQLNRIEEPILTSNPEGEEKCTEGCTERHGCPCATCSGMTKWDKCASCSEPLPCENILE